MVKIPYARQDINQVDIDAVVELLRSDFLTQGPTVPLFEETVANYCGAQHAIAVNSATSALHIACLALGVRKGDIVWTSPITFVASANCALYCGANIDFVDIDPRTYNMDVESLAEKLLIAKKSDKLPKVVIPVHLCGQPCDMDEIYKLSKRYGFRIIEDASHAIGGKYKGQPIGNCRYSDITVFSFHPVKIITTGEGGMAVTNSANLAKQMRLMRSHGITNDSSTMLPRPELEIWNYQQIELGFNYRLTDLQAALGLTQMLRIDEFVSKRHTLARRYSKFLSYLPLQVPWQHPDSYSGFHLYVIRLKLNEIKKTQKQIYFALQQEGIMVNLHYIPVYCQPYYEMLGFKAGYCQIAEQYFVDAISIPMYPTLREEDQDRVITALSSIVC
jgi:UDP-4-amino-4,6-dideoxy-N-acetyl-beta-L-altrosamine transaminase